MSEKTKVGIISCSGEELCEGTISRLAARRVLEQLRPDNTVTICLPLFLAGSEEERAFARHFPTITVDGCAECCAKKGTEAHSGPVTKSLTVPEILGETSTVSGETSCARLTARDLEAVRKVAEEIARQVDEILARDSREKEAPKP